MSATHPDITVVDVDDRTFFVVGTAHISRESADLVREVIVREKPDCVCLELDEKRLAALQQPDAFAALDLKHIIRTQQLAALFLNLILASYQKRLGGSLGVLPGAELLEAAHAAEAEGIPVALCDRDIRITLRRAWTTMSWWRKSYFFSVLIGSIFEQPQLDEDGLRELRQSDVTTKLIEELGKEFPSIKQVLIDERDSYLAEKIRSAPGRRVVAVVGAGHRAGVQRKLSEERCVDLGALEVIPPLSPVWKWVGWGIPALILGSIAYIGWSKGAAAANQSLQYWVLATGVPSFLGAVVALAHPLTAVTAFVAAPLTTLTPVIGIGYVTAFLQAYLRPPLVREFHSIGRDITIVRRWWQNRLLRVMLVFIFTSLGGMLGTFLGGAEIISKLF
jgi:pheromone shutdown-related protein TraB